MNNNYEEPTNRNDADGSCKQISLDSYEALVEALKKVGITIVRPATKDEQVNEHWDFLVEYKGIQKKLEVKGLKRLNRSDANRSGSTVVLEWQACRYIDDINRPGWIQGKYDIIAFLMDGEFWVFERDTLLNWFISTFNPENMPVCDSPKYGKKLHTMYTRKGLDRQPRYDKWLIVLKEELRKVPHKVWKV